MVIYKNIVRYDDLPFKDYLEINKNFKAMSFSFMNREKYGQIEDVEVTMNMRTGSLVDDILTNPSYANMKDTLYPFCKKIAFEIKEKFGSLISKFEKQVSFTAIAEHKGFKLHTTGRLDFGLKDFAVIDLKVTFSKDVKALIKHMGYSEQVWHYAKLYNVKKAFIMIHSLPLNKTYLIEINISESSEFWENKILKFGNN